MSKQKMKKFISTILTLTLLITLVIPGIAVAQTSTSRTKGEVVFFLDANKNAAKQSDPQARVEREEYRTRNSLTYQRPDGTLETEVYLEPIFYTDDQGQWVEVDNSLILDSVETVEVPIDNNIDEESKQNEIFKADVYPEPTDYSAPAAVSNASTESVDSTDLTDTEDYAETDITDNLIDNDNSFDVGDEDSLLPEESALDEELVPDTEESALTNPEETITAENVVNESINENPNETAVIQVPLYQNAGNDFTVTLPGTITESTPLEISAKQSPNSKKEWKMTLLPLDGKYSNAGVQDSSLYYSNILENIDVRYTVRSYGLKEEIILQEAPAPNTFTYQIDSDELSFVGRQGVVFAYAPGEDEPVFYLSAPGAIDNAGNVCEDTTLSLDGNIVTLRVNQNWLDSPQRSYPVVIDPDVTFNDGVMDVCVREGTDEVGAGSNNFNGECYIGYDDGIASKNLETYGYKHEHTRTYIKVTLPDTLGENQVIDSANFYFYVYTKMGVTDRVIDIEAINEDVDYYSLSWNNQPTDIVKMGTIDLPAQVTGFYQGDIKKLVQYWHDGGQNNGFRLSINDESNNQAEKFHGRNQVLVTEETRPYITITSHDSATERTKIRSGQKFNNNLYCNDAIGGDPVDLITGNFFWSYTDLALYGSEELTFTRHYNAKDDAIGSLGRSWRHSYSYTLEEDPDRGDVTIVTPECYEIAFAKNLDGTFQNPEDADFTLGKTAGGYLLTYRDKTEYQFDANNNLVSITERNGEVTTLTYSDDKLTSVSNKSGVLSLSYTGDQISAVSDGTGRQISYAYDGDLLTTYTNPDDDTIDYVYNANSLLSHIIDFNGNTYLENAYDAYNRLVEQYIADQGISTVQYNDGYNTVSFADGSVANYHYDEEQRLTKIEEADGARGYTYQDGRLLEYSDRLGNSTAYKYDEEGNITAISYPDGTIESYVYNDLNLATQITHKDGTVTKYVYDDSGNLTSYTDARGNSWTWAYDDNNNLISSIDALGNTTTYSYNAQGNSLTQTDPLGSVTAFEYDKQNRPIKQIYPDNSSVEYEYTTAGKLAKITDAASNVQTYVVNGNGYNESVSDFMGYATAITYDKQNTPLIISDQEGHTTTYEYNTVGSKIKTTDTLGNAVAYSYDERGRLATMTDARGNTWTYAYDPEGRQTLATDPLGNSNAKTYDSMGRTIQTTDTTGAVTSYTYDAMGRVLRTTDALNHYSGNIYDQKGNVIEYHDKNGNIWTYEYDANNRLTKAVDPLGYESAYEYDANGQATKNVSALNNQKQRIYDNMGRVITAIDPEGNQTGYAYDILGRLVKTTFADGTEITNEYNANGWLTKTADQNGAVTSYTYNKNGQILTITDALGGVNATAYDALGCPVSETDALGAVTKFTYDQNGNLISTTDALGNTISSVYDQMNRMTSLTDARGNTWAYGYDSEGRQTSVTDALGNTVATTYDALGRTIQTTNGRGASTNYSYDPNGNAAQITDALGNASRNVYDANNHLIEQYDKNGNIWTYAYDAENRLIQTTDPLGFVTAYAYDKNGQTTKTVSALSFEHQMVYNDVGRLIQETDHEGNITVYEYDNVGRLTKTTYADGTSVANEYNAKGWLIETTDQNGAVTSYSYDLNGNLLSTTDAHGGVTAKRYDLLNRLLSTTDGLGGVTGYSYDQNGNLLSTTDALGHVTANAYDALNRLTTVTDPLGGITAAEYDQNGNITKVTTADGGVTTYTYDLLDQLTGYTDAEGYTFSFAYDANGNQIQSTDGRGNSSTTTYDALNRPVAQTDEAGYTQRAEYDADGRLVKITDKEGAVTNYLYDKNNNVVQITDALGNATTFTYDSLGRVVTVTDALGAVTACTYTPTGQIANLTDALGGVKTYKYDLLGQLIKETNELGQSTEYTYDALGRVTSVQNALGNNDHLAYDALGRITSVTDKNGNATKYVHDANGNIIETIDANNHSSYFAYDAMNQLVQVRLYRVDTQDNVNEEQITLYQYDKRGLLTKTIDAQNNNVLHIYDQNGNLIQTTDQDGYVTQSGYDPRNLVEQINYTGGKEVQFAYNKNGELTAMMDWNGTVNFALDVLGRLTSVNDQNEKITSYIYDAVGNQTAIKYPDNTAATSAYDLLGRLTNLKDAENQNTVYDYDAASQLISRAYPNGWQETKTYDAAGQLLTQVSADPTDTASKTVTHEYTYDPEGNILTEYRSGAGGQDRFNLTHTYDALNRLTSTTGDQGYKAHTYLYDSLGNLTHEQIHNKGTDYKYNSLNQQVQKTVDGKDTYNYTFDKRGNLTKGVYAKKNTVIEEYAYDATNRMVKGVNESGEQSFYIYNGLGHLVGNEWIIEKNNYGYTGVNTTPSAQVDGVVVCDRHSNTTGQGHINPTGKGHTTGGTTGGVTPTIDNKKFQVVHKDYVLDYTSKFKDTIMEMESGTGALTYRYVYGLDKIETVISGIPNGAGAVMQYVYDDSEGEWVLTNTEPSGTTAANSIVKLYSHQDHLGSTDYLTDNVAGKAVSYVTYDDWGAPTAKAILKCGVRELDLVQEYTGHPYDQVLNVFYAKARMYDAADRRFMAADPVKGSLRNPQTLMQYAYVLNNSLKYTDPTGLYTQDQLMESYNYMMQKGYVYTLSTDKSTGKTVFSRVENANAQGDAVNHIMWMFDKLVPDSEFPDYTLYTDKLKKISKDYYGVDGNTMIGPYLYFELVNLPKVQEAIARESASSSTTQASWLYTLKTVNGATQFLVTKSGGPDVSYIMSLLDKAVPDNPGPVLYADKLAKMNKQFWHVEGDATIGPLTLGMLEDEVRKKTSIPTATPGLPNYSSYYPTIDSQYRDLGSAATVYYPPLPLSSTGNATGTTVGKAASTVIGKGAKIGGVFGGVVIDMLLNPTPTASDDMKPYVGPNEGSGTIEYRLPAWDKVQIDWSEIISGHTVGGGRGGPNKDRFPEGMDKAAIAAALQYAYKNAEKLSKIQYSWQNGIEHARQLYQGPWGNRTIHFWFDFTTKTIDTAYPK